MTPAEPPRRGGDRPDLGDNGVGRLTLEWSAAARPCHARESLFVTLVGSPATGALLGLAETADARGDAAAAG